MNIHAFSMTQTTITAITQLQSYALNHTVTGLSCL